MDFTIYRKVALVLILVLLFMPTLPGNAYQIPLADSDPVPSSGDIGWKGGFSVNGTDNTAYVVAIDGKNVYVAGYFTAVGNVLANSIARWDGSTWAALGSGFNDFVYALAIDGHGNLYAGGWFTQADGKPANHIARWDGQDWESLGNGIDGVVVALAVDAFGDVYVGGNFNHAGGVEANNIAIWNGSAWRALGSGISSIYPKSGTVDAILIDRYGFVYVGGDFTHAGGKPANNIARWDGVGWMAMGSGITGQFPYDSPVFALAADNRGNVFAGGKFDTAGGLPASNLAKWNGEAWSAVSEKIQFSGEQMQATVTSILADGGDIYIGGVFDSIGGIPFSGIARWDGTTWENMKGGFWRENYAAYITSMSIDRDGQIFTAGVFSMAGGKSANNVAVWDGSTWSGLGTDYSVDAPIDAMIPDHKGGMYIGGNFRYAGGITVNHIAYWNGMNWSDLTGGVSGYSVTEIWSLALDSQGNLYAGGQFTHAGNTPAANVAKWNGFGWEALGSGLSGMVTVLTIDSQDHLYASGVFSTAGGEPANNIAEWNGTQWEALGSGLYGSVAYALAIDDQDRLVAGGSFQKAGGVPTYGLARWDGEGWEDLSGSIHSAVTSLTFHDGTLYLGGMGKIWKMSGDIFDQVGEPLSAPGQPASIQAIAFDNLDRMIVGGYFNLAGNVPANNIARWNGTQWETLGSGTNSWVNSIVMSLNGNLIVGGAFSQAGGKVSRNLANWQEPYYAWLPVVSQ